MMADRLLVLFVIGAVLGTLGDFSHVDSLTLGYPPLGLLLPGGQPFWVPLLFGSATIAIGVSHPWVNGWLGPKNFKKPSLIRSFAGCSFFLGLYCASSYLPFDTGGLKDLILMMGAWVTWVLFDRTWQGIFLGFCTAVLGCGVEIGLTHSGAFFYYPASSNFYQVPSWLPWLYFSASVGVGNLGRFLTKLKEA